MRLTIVGSGDAFGSGGRLQTCFHLAAPEGSGDGELLIDCGATALIGLQRCGLDPSGVATVLLSHLHGDHFSGLVWYLLHAQHIARRTAPLTIAGPPGTEARVKAASEVLFPGSTQVASRFSLSFVDYAVGGTTVVGGASVAAFEVVHPSGAPSCALRVETAGRVLTYSGDTQWEDVLIEASAGADLFICECFAAKPGAPYHIDWPTLRTKLPAITARHILLTHMNAGMLAIRDTIAEPRVAFADDGLVLEL